MLLPVPEDKGFAPAVSGAEIMIYATFRSGSLSSGPVCISYVKYARFEPLSKHPWPHAASYSSWLQLALFHQVIAKKKQQLKKSNRKSLFVVVCVDIFIKVLPSLLQALDQDRTSLQKVKKSVKAIYNSGQGEAAQLSLYPAEMMDV